MTAHDTGSVTVLRSLNGVLTKRVSRGPSGWHVTGFSAGTWYAMLQMPADSFDQLVTGLDWLSGQPACAVVRGRIRSGVDSLRCRRLCDRVLHGDAVTLDPAANHVLGIDVDSLPEPLGCTFAAEPEEGIEHAISRLPEAFHEASCWWQATGSAGIKPGIRCRLWFWLSRPIEDAEAKGWLAGAPVDRSLYSPAALHYVAAPILAPGTSSPVARRHGVRRGLDDVVAVPAELPRLERQSLPVALDGRELSTTDLEHLAAAAGRSRTVRAIWTGERSYPDRSTGHFAFAAALARAGCRDADTIHRAIVALDQRHGRDATKALSTDYATRTIAAALAAATSP